MADRVKHEPGLRFTSHKNLQLVIWYAAPTLEQVRSLGIVSASLRRQYPAGIALLNVSRGTTVPRFSDEVRNEVMRLLREDYHKVARAYVVLTRGLAGITSRAFLSTVTLMGRSNTPTRVFDGTSEAAAWLGPLLAKTDATWSAAAVTEALSTVMVAL